MTWREMIRQFTAPRTCHIDKRVARLVDEFRETRLQDMAELLESRGTVGAQLAIDRQEIACWRRYACQLERACLATGIELPPAPDD